MGLAEEKDPHFDMTLDSPGRFSLPSRAVSDFVTSLELCMFEEVRSRKSYSAGGLSYMLAQASGMLVQKQKG